MLEMWTPSKHTDELQQQYEQVKQRYDKAYQIMNDPGTSPEQKSKWQRAYDDVCRQLDSLKRQLGIESDLDTEMTRLFQELTARMNALPGWCPEVNEYIKTTQPKLYSEWSEAEYMLNERCGLGDAEGFSGYLKQYEAICLQILDLWNKRKGR